MHPRHAVSFLGMAIIALSLCAQAQTFRFNSQRTGNAAQGIRLPLQRVQTVKGGGAFVSSPVVVNDTVYVGCRDSCLYAFHKSNLLWRFRTRGWVDASVAYDNGRIYCGSRDGCLYILKASNGDSLGVIENGNTQCSSPLVYDSTIVFGRGGWNNEIKAWNVHTGAYRWHTNNTQMVYSTPAFDNGQIFYGENGGNLVSCDALSGVKKWEFQTNGCFYLSSPAVEQGLVYCSPGEYNRTVFCVDANTGLEVWSAVPGAEAGHAVANAGFVRRLMTQSPDYRSRMVAGASRLYKMLPEQVEALAAIAGPTLGKAAFTSFGAVASSSPAIGETDVFVVHMEYGYPSPMFTLTAFDKLNGQEQWHFSEQRTCMEIGICASPVVADSVVFAGWGQGKLYAFHAETGDLLWQDSLGSDIIASPAIGNGKLYAATADGRLVAYASAVRSDDFQRRTYCYPNPAKGESVHIRIFTPAAGQADIIVYNSVERPVIRFAKKLPAMQASDEEIFDWNLKGVANGVYFVRIKMTYDNGRTEKKVLKIAVLK